MELHLSQTFESLNNSILTNILQNVNRLDAVNSGVSDEKTTKRNGARQPKPRDGHTCEVHGKQMIIFGGDRHHMSFNDIVLVNLEKVINSDSKSVGRVEEE